MEGSCCAGGLPTVTYSHVEIPFSSTSMSPLHYKNTPMQCTAIFHGCKTDNFQIKNCDFFLVFARNMGWTHLGTEAFLTGAHALYFRAEIGRKCKPQFCYIKMGGNRVYIARA